MRILYVEDNPTAREYVGRGLSEHGFEVDDCATGEEGLRLAVCAPYDLLILDVMLPKRDGFQVLQELREKGVETPVLVLSARSEPTDRIRGLNLGADDYLVKPFALGELVARIRAVARRSIGDPAEGRLQVADLTMDVEQRAVTRGGVPVELTAKEFQLLAYLMRNEGRALSRTMITQNVWGYEFESYSNVIDVHINHLRRKIDRGGTFKLIHTVKGVGYVLEDRRPPGAPDEGDRA